MKAKKYKAAIELAHLSQKATWGNVAVIKIEGEEYTFGFGSMSATQKNHKEVDIEGNKYILNTDNRKIYSAV